MESDTMMEVDNKGFEKDIKRSPYLSAVQSLPGNTPGEKYKTINTLVQGIIAGSNEPCSYNGDVATWDACTPALHPLIKAHIGKKLRLTGEIEEALKCPDVKVVNVALRAKWFFYSTNDYINTAYVANILPLVSKRTKLRIIKRLSQSLANDEAKGEQFFNFFYDRYGFQEAFQFITCCSEQIIDGILTERQVVLSTKTLGILFKKHPKLVIDYMHKMTNNADEKDKVLEPVIRFVPRLIKNHTSDYIVLFEKLSGKQWPKLGCKLTHYLTRNNPKYIMSNIHKYQDCSFRSLRKNLTLKQYMKVLGNLCSEQRSSFDFFEILKLLRYDAIENRLDLITDIYKNKYGEELLTRLEFFNIQSRLKEMHGLLTLKQIETFVSHLVLKRKCCGIDDVLPFLAYYPQEKILQLLHRVRNQGEQGQRCSDGFLSFEYKLLFSYLTGKERTDEAKRLMMNPRPDLDSFYYECCCYLPIDESLKMLMDAYNSSSPPKEGKLSLVTKMIMTCKINKSQEGLLEFLSFYNDRHKNALPSTFRAVLPEIVKALDAMNPNVTLLSEFYKLVIQQYVFKNLFLSGDDVVHLIFSKIHLLLGQSDNDAGGQVLFDKLVNIYLEFKIEFYSRSPWDILPSNPKLEMDVLDKMIRTIPQIYPEDHTTWKDKVKRVQVLMNIVSKLHEHNVIKKKNQNNDKNYPTSARLSKMEDYTWLANTICKIFKESNDCGSLVDNLRSVIREYDPEFHRSKIPPTSECVRQMLLNGRVRGELKNHPEIILANWEQYLHVCRSMLYRRSKKAARKFVLALKWHNELPIKFIERCSLEIGSEGSLDVLGILVEGESLGELLSRYAPRAPSMDIYELDPMGTYKILPSFPSAVNASNPPVDLTFLLPFIQNTDNSKIMLRVISRLGRHVEKTKVLGFIDLLWNNPNILKKSAIFLLISEVGDFDEVQSLLRKLYAEKREPWHRRMVTRKILSYAKELSDEKIQSLVDICIDIVTVDDDADLGIFISKIHALPRRCCPEYVKKLLTKVEALAVNDDHTKWKEKWIVRILTVIEEKMVICFPKELILDILRKYFFRTHSWHVSMVTMCLARLVFSSSLARNNKKALGQKKL
ncbi:uncharacterized protein LOC106638790 [Copidosoma floridanum]|uniref:uncharacterized protein LOC106638790 n=1 Tax=Copidosoma floridanum TaxID=29053 RepID=UPI0006C9829C|nr:uncharacterized protein LOC106638790 [Copidosoma floridanum]